MPAANTFPRELKSDWERVDALTDEDIRLDPEGIEYFRAGGEGRQSRINEVPVEYIVEQSDEPAAG